VTVAPRPLAGSQPSCTLNTMISMRATQKAGSEKPTMLVAISVLDSQWSGFMPAYSPNGTPSTTAISKALTASSSVAGRRCRIRRTASS
jgi:hypothetical protein